MTKPRFSGVYPVLYAYRGADQRLDKEAMRRQIECCLAAGAHGITVLGLVTEVFRMSTTERLQVVEWTSEIVAGRVPIAVTVAETTTYGQIDFCHEATRLGATWLILQPPSIKGVTEAELVRFLGTVANACTIPVAVQNNPIAMDVSLSNAALLALHRDYPNISLMKAEGHAMFVSEFALKASGTCDIFAGHGGLEYLTNLRSGVAGLIPAPEVLDVQVRLHKLWAEGTPESRQEAEALHRAILQVLVFMSRGLPIVLTYGKRLMAKRIGLDPVHAVMPEPVTTDFGIQEIDRFYDLLGPMRKADESLSPGVLKAAGLSAS